METTYELRAKLKSMQRTLQAIKKNDKCKRAASFGNLNNSYIYQ